MKPVTHLAAFPFLALALAGCHSHKGIGTIGNNGHGIDPTWTRAARSCWPELAKNGYTTDDINRNLADPTHFRNAFPVYSAQTDDALNTELATPVQTMPAPDVSKLTHSSTPVFNRGQAVDGTSPKDAVVQSTDGTVPPDAFCSIQTGIPQGFSK